MLGPSDYLEESKALTEQQTQTPKNKNRFLDEYNGKPTLETIRQLILQKRENGDLDRKIWVDVGWALDKEEFFISQTNMTYSMVQNAPHQLYSYEQRMLKAEQNRDLEHRKCQDLLVENALVYQRLEQMAAEMKEMQSVLSENQNQSKIVKLPISRVRTFLAFCKPEDDIEDFYVKINDKGNMERIVRKPEEL